MVSTELAVEYQLITASLCHLTCCSQLVEKEDAFAGGRQKPWWHPFGLICRDARETDYVFSEEAYLDWIGNAPEPCAPPRSWRHSGICRGEMLRLMKDCVRLYSKPIAGHLFGSLLIKRGLKRRVRKRTLEVDSEMKDVLQALLATSKCNYVFSHPGSS
jgi:hypothetical protein